MSEQENQSSFVDYGSTKEESDPKSISDGELDSQSENGRENKSNEEKNAKRKNV